MNSSGGTITSYIYQKPQQCLGVLLFFLYLLQLFGEVVWETLINLQAYSLYKQLSGFVILAYIGAQWWLAYLRFSGRKAAAAQHIKVHKWMGVIAPVLLLMHTVETGHAYQTLLLTVFIIVAVSGLFSFHDIKLKKRWFVVSWTILHVALAIVLPMLVLYHIYITYHYS